MLNSDRPRRIKRGPLRTRWLNPGLGRNRPGKYIKPATYSNVAGAQIEDEQPAEDDPEVDEDEEDEPDNADGDEEFNPENDRGDIQIVDLHSNNPLVTYNGSAFSCKWAANVGTELLFKAHDRDSTIPVLRNLTGGVDLLAVNQARIVSDRLELQPRKRKRSPPRAFVRGSHISHTKYLIPIGAHASSRRKDQAVFLERLINMKAKMGETDSVTVVAEKRVPNGRWKPRVEELRNKERAEFRAIIDNPANNANNPEVQAAKQKLQDMDDEDDRLSRQEPSMGKRRVAAKAMRKKAKEDEAKDSASAEQQINKPRRGRPPKGLHAPGTAK